MMYDKEGVRAAHSMQSRFLQGDYLPPHVKTPQNSVPVHHLSPSQLMISSQYAELVEKSDNRGYGRDFAASMIYSTEESGQPLDFNTLFGKIMQQGETSRKSFEAMNFMTEVTAAPHDIGGRSYDTAGENHDFEPVTVPRTLHSPSQFVVPPEVEEEILLDSIKEIRKDVPFLQAMTIMRYKALEEVQRSTLQMFIDLQRQFNELQRKTQVQNSNAYIMSCHA